MSVPYFIEQAERELKEMRDRAAAHREAVIADARRQGAFCDGDPWALAELRASDVRVHVVSRRELLEQSRAPTPRMVALIRLPGADGVSDIYIDRSLSAEQQAKSLAHELAHMMWPRSFSEADCELWAETFMRCGASAGGPTVKVSCAAEVIATPRAVATQPSVLARMARLGDEYGERYRGNPWALVNSRKGRIAVRMETERELAARRGQAAPRGQTLYGLTVWKGGSDVIEVFLNCNVDTDEQDRTLAHELGHVVGREEFGQGGMGEDAAESFARCFMSRGCRR